MSEIQQLIRQIAPKEEDGDEIETAFDQSLLKEQRGSPGNLLTKEGLPFDGQSAGSTHVKIKRGKVQIDSAT